MVATSTVWTAAQLRAELGLLHGAFPGDSGWLAGRRWQRGMCRSGVAGCLDVSDVVAAAGDLARRWVCYGGFLHPGEQDPDVAERSYQGQYQGRGDYV